MESTETKTNPLAELDLSRFCDPDSSRFALQQPWRADGFIYASDGKVAIRIPDDGRGLIEAEGRKPRISEIFEPYFSQVEEWQSLPDDVDCCLVDSCIEGVQTQECSKCSGYGTRECDMGHEHQCGKCDGSGKQKEDCEECCVKLANRSLYRKFVCIFLPVPNLQWGVCPSRNAADDPIYFRGDGGFAGIAMPKREGC